MGEAFESAVWVIVHSWVLLCFSAGIVSVNDVNSSIDFLRAL